MASFRPSGFPRYLESTETGCNRKWRLCFSKSGLSACKNSAVKAALGWGRPQPCLWLRPHNMSMHQGTIPALLVNKREQCSVFFSLLVFTRCFSLEICNKQRPKCGRRFYTQVQNWTFSKSTVQDFLSILDQIWASEQFSHVNYGWPGPVPQVHLRSYWIWQSAHERLMNPPAHLWS